MISRDPLSTPDCRQVTSAYSAHPGKTTLPLPVIVGFALYVMLLGAALTILPPFVVFAFGALPLSLLYFNQTWDFKAPYRLLHLLFVAMVASFILWPRFLAFNFGGPDITPSRIVNALLLCVWALVLLSPSYRKEVYGLVRGMGIWTWLLASYVLFRIASSFASEAPLLSLYQTANEILTAVLILPIALSLYRDRSRLDTLIAGLFLAGVCVAVLAIIEKLAGHNLFANLHIPGMHMDGEWVQQSLRDKMRAGQYRAQATFMHPLLLAEFMTFEIPLALYYIAHPRWHWRLLGGIAFFLFVAGAVATGSRAALVAIPPMILMSIVLLSLRRSPGSRGGALWIMTLLTLCLCVAAGIVVLAMGLVDLSVITGRNAHEISSTYSRLMMFNRGLPLIAEQPFVGYGPGLSGAMVGLANAHGEVTIDNYYLSLALDSGLPALLAFMALSFGLAAKGYLTALRNVSREGLLCGLLAISLVGMLIVKSILTIPHNAPLLYLIFALVTTIPMLLNEKEEPCSSPRTSR